jgi:hypothetical protein
MKKTFLRLVMSFLVLAVALAAFVQPVEAATTYTKTCYATVYYGGVKRAAFQETIKWESRTYLGVKQSRLLSTIDTISYKQSGWTLSSKQVGNTLSTSWENALGSSLYWGERLVSYKVTRTSDGFSPGRYYVDAIPYWGGTIKCTSNWV